MSSYKALLEQRDELERKIEEARETEVSSALATVKSLVSEFGYGSGCFRPSKTNTEGESICRGVEIS